jgi:hypothetical protein
MHRRTNPSATQGLKRKQGAAIPGMQDIRTFLIPNLPPPAPTPSDPSESLPSAGAGITDTEMPQAQQHLPPKDQGAAQQGRSGKKPRKTKRLRKRAHAQAPWKRLCVQKKSLKKQYDKLKRTIAPSAGPCPNTLVSPTTK